MNYMKFDLGNLNSDRVVEVTLQGTAANVRLLDSSNFYNYTRGKIYNSIGGLTRLSPITFTIPSYDHWYVVVDMEGLKGKAEASVKIH